MNDPVRASYLVSGVPREKIFSALLDVQRFTEWSHGLRQLRLLHGATEMSPGVGMEFVLSAAGLTHSVESVVTVVETPHRIEWRYTSGAVGSGGWTLEEAGPDTVRMTLYTDYEVEPAWLNRISHKPFFRRIAEDLLRRSMRRFVQRLKEP
jgi:uncharacterized protein YndB with AHSA1/START domain